MKKFKTVFLHMMAGMIWWGTSSLLYAQDHVPFSLTGRWSEGECYAITGQDSIAYYADGATLVTLDVHDPAHPQRLHSMTMGGIIWGLSIQQNFLYVAGSPGYMEVVDISFPEYPQLTGHLDLPDEPGALEIEIAGSFAYLSAESEGLMIVDISNPSLPVLISHTLSDKTINSIAIQGDYAYAATGEGLAILDVSDKMMPLVTGELDLDQWCRGIEYHNGLAILAAINLGVVIADVSDPAQPAVISMYHEGGHAEDVMYRNDLLYVANRYAGMFILDISDPAHPVRKGSISTRRAATIMVDHHWAYIADTWQMSVVDVSNADTLRMVVSVDAGDILRHISVKGDHIYVANNYDGMKAIRIPQMSQPVTVYTFDESHSGYDVLVRDTLLYLSDLSQGLITMSLTQPDTPRRVHTLPVDVNMEQLEMNGDYLFGMSSDGFTVINVEAPETPVFVGFYPLEESPVAISTYGNLLFNCAGTEGLWIYDLTNIQTPQQIGFIETGSWAMDIAVDGNLAYMAEGGIGLTVLDISDPALPVRLLSIDPGGSARKVRVRGDFAYLVEHGKGLYVYDISEVPDIREVALYPTLSTFDDLALSGNQIFLLEEYDGVFILTFDSLALSVYPSDRTEGQPDFRFSSAPNPFTDQVELTYAVDAACRVTLDVFDQQGQFVATLLNRYHQPGQYQWTWTPVTGNLSSGIYRIRITLDHHVYQKSMVYIR